MRVLKQVFLTFAIVVGLSVAASAQKDGPKKPPKENPPVVTPGQKPKDNPPPRNNDGNKPKKPGYAIEIVDRRAESHST
jgi:hypothetical protein